MRNELLVLVSALVLASTMGTPGCSSNPTGGSGSGGSSSGTTGGEGGVAASCSNVSGCGGTLVGTWNAMGSCLKVSGTLDLSANGSGFGCAAPQPVTGGTLQVSGTFTANSNGTFTDNTTTSGNEEFTLDSSCLVISSTPTDCQGAESLLAASVGFSSVSCTSSAGGGCNCSGTVSEGGSSGCCRSARRQRACRRRACTRPPPTRSPSRAAARATRTAFRGTRSP